MGVFGCACLIVWCLGSWEGDKLESWARLQSDREIVWTDILSLDFRQYQPAQIPASVATRIKVYEPFGFVETVRTD